MINPDCSGMIHYSFPSERRTDPPGLSGVLSERPTSSDNPQIEIISESEECRQIELTPIAVTKLFDRLLENALSLLDPSNEKILSEVIFQDVDTLIGFTDNILKEGDNIKIRLDNNFTTAHDELMEMGQRLSNSKAQLLESEISFSRLNVTKDLLEDRRYHLETNIRTMHRKKAREKEVRINALVDLVPFAGFFAAIGEKDYKRMIPGYSQVRGIISEASQNVENYERELNQMYLTRLELFNEISSVLLNIQNNNAEIHLINDRINTLTTGLNLQEASIKQLGKDLVILGDINLGLKIFRSDCEFLRKNVTTAIKFVQGLSNVTKVHDLANRIRDIQGKFNDTFVQRIIDPQVSALFSPPTLMALPHHTNT